MSRKRRQPFAPCSDPCGDIRFLIVFRSRLARVRGDGEGKTFLTAVKRTPRRVRFARPRQFGQIGSPSDGEKSERICFFLSHPSPAPLFVLFFACHWDTRL